MADGWVKVEDLLKEMRANDPAYNASIVGLGGVPNDPMQRWRYIVARRNVRIRSSKQRPLIRLWDKDMNFIARLTGERQAEWQELIHSSGAGRVVIQRQNWLADFLIKDVRADEDLHITIDPRPTKRSWETRWAGKVTAAHVKRTSDGIHEVELELLSIWEHWKHIAFAANPVLPPEFQFPKIYLVAMNTRSAVCYTGTLNLMRQYNPVLAVFTNLLNPGHWLTPVQDPSKGRNVFDPLNWPVQMEYVNPVLDQSRFTFLAARWSMADVACEPILKDAGCFMRPVMFLTEDEKSPHTDLAAIIGNKRARPRRNSVVFRCLQKNGVGGPTGTMLDGIFDLVGATADDLITELVFPVDRDGDGITDPLFRKWLGVAPAKPKVVFADGEFSGIIESDRIQYKATARTILTGGKSPPWLNQAQTFGIRYGLAQLSAVISYGLGAYQQYGPPGLDNLYQGQLDDTAFAFQKYTDPKRVFAMGRHALLEHMEQ